MGGWVGEWVGGWVGGWVGKQATTLVTNNLVGGHTSAASPGTRKMRTSLSSAQSRSSSRAHSRCTTAGTPPWLSGRLTWLGVGLALGLGLGLGVGLARGWGWGWGRGKGKGKDWVWMSGRVTREESTPPKTATEGLQLEARCRCEAK